MAISTKYSIERRIIAKGKSRSGLPLTGKVLFIVAHETGNNSADADDHFTYFNRHVIASSAHTFIDDSKILEIIPLNEKAWHVQFQKAMDNILFGDDANDRAIGVELCRTGNFAKAYDRYVWYMAYLCRKFGLKPNKHIVSHKVLDLERRYDPQSWLQPHGISWERFISDVTAVYNAWTGGSVGVEAPKTEVKSAATSNPEKVLRKGDKGAEIKALQKKLIAVGFKLRRFGADGHYGDETVTAVKAFQKAVGISVDGIYGPDTDNKLDHYKKLAKKNESKSAVVPYPGKLIRRGARGKNVERIQRAVGVAADGIFGRGTERAVKAYQKRHGLGADGIVGPATWNVMF